MIKTNGTLNKEEILTPTERFKLDNIKNIQRFKELINELYKDDYLLFATLDLGENTSHYISIIKVTNHTNLAEKLIETFDEMFDDYLIEFTNKSGSSHHISVIVGKIKHSLINYNSGIIELCVL